MLVALPFASIAEQISNKKLIYGKMKRAETVQFVINDSHFIHSLHTETKCGQFQSWHCNKCTSISDDPKVHASVEDRAKPIHKSDIVAHDMALNGYGESLEETCSVFIEDPILMAMKREDDLNWEQCEEGDENDQIIIDEFKREDLIDEYLFRNILIPIMV